MHAWRVPLVLAAAAALLTGCASAAGDHGTAGAAVHATKTVSLGDPDTIRAPANWSVSRFHGTPATVVFPLVFLSSRALAPACVPGRKGISSCETGDWFSPRWRTPGDGVLVMWLETTLPNDAWFRDFHGRHTRVDDHPAKTAWSDATDCAPGAKTEFNATVRPWHQDTSLLDLRACFGPHAPRADRSAVVTMLHSLRVRSPN